MLCYVTIKQHVWVLAYGSSADRRPFQGVVWRLNTGKYITTIKCRPT